MVQFARNKSDVHAKKDGDYEEHYKTRMQKKGIDQPFNTNKIAFLIIIIMIMIY